MQDYHVKFWYEHYRPFNDVMLSLNYYQKEFNKSFKTKFVKIALSSFNNKAINI